MALFEKKGETRDEVDVIWNRIHFPYGIWTIIDQKIRRIPPMLGDWSPGNGPGNVNWAKLIDELHDAANYLHFIAAQIQMLLDRWAEKEAPF